MSGQICFAKGCNWGPIWGSLGYYAKKVLNEKQLPKMQVVAQLGSYYTVVLVNYFTEVMVAYQVVGNWGVEEVTCSKPHIRRKFLKMKSLASCVQTLLLCLPKVIQCIFVKVRRYSLILSLGSGLIFVHVTALIQMFSGIMTKYLVLKSNRR